MRSIAARRINVNWKINLCCSNFILIQCVLMKFFRISLRVLYHLILRFYSLILLILLIFSYSFLVVQAAERLMSILNLNVYCVVRTLLIATFILHTVTQ